MSELHVSAAQPLPHLDKPEAKDSLAVRLRQRPVAGGRVVRLNRKLRSQVQHNRLFTLFINALLGLLLLGLREGTSVCTAYGK